MNYSNPFSSNTLFESFFSIITTVAVILIILTIGLALIYFKRKYHRFPFELKLRRNAEGIIFGKIGPIRICSPSDSEGHVGVFGGSGFGKTSALLIPTLQAWNGCGSLTIDVSGDISDNVCMNDMVIFDPLDSDTIPYDVFAAIDKLASSEEQNAMLAKLAYLIIPENPGDSSAAMFFSNGGRKILTASLIAFYHDGLDFIEICKKVVRTDWPTLFDEIDKTDNPDAIMYINGFYDPGEGSNSNTSGCKENCDSALMLFATDRNISKAMHRPVSDSRSLTPENVEFENIFVRIREEDLNLYAPLVRIIVAQNLEYLSSRPLDAKGTIGLFLDEFKAIGHMGDVSGALARLRKRKVRIMILSQSTTDLELVYSHNEMKVMLSNMKYKCLLNVSEPEEQEYFAKLIGRHKITEHNCSWSLSLQRRTMSNKKEEYIIPPSELANLSSNLVVIYPGGHIKLRKNYYYK